MRRSYDTLSEAINALQDEGYNYDFNLCESHLACKSLGQNFAVEEFHIDEVFRFEGYSSVDDASILFAITTSSGLKGLLIDAYGTYSDSISPEMIAKLRRYCWPKGNVKGLFINPFLIP